MRWATTATLVLAASAWAPRARADAESDAKDLFERGRTLRTAGDCASAVPLFHKAYDVYSNGLGSLRNAAECEESLGRWASARRSWLELKRATIFAHDAKYQGWDADADAADKRLAPKVAHLRVDVDTGGRADARVAVTLNGEPLARDLVGTVLDRDPGRYVVRADAGGAPAEVAVDLGTGESRVVRLDVATQGAPVVIRVVRPETQGSALTPAGWVTLSVGLVALAGMGVAIGVRQDALSTLDAECPQHVGCSPNLASTVSRGQAASTAATALAVGGGIVAGAGLLLIALGAVTPHKEQPVSVSVSPWGFSVGGTF